MRVTQNLVRVAVALLDDPRGRHWGYDIIKRAGIRSGALYPLLTRLMAEGWLTDGWEDPTTILGRPPRRYYELTEDGLRELTAIARRADVSGACRRGLAWGQA